jgi:hypothetical protein
MSDSDFYVGEQKQTLEGEGRPAFGGSLMFVFVFVSASWRIILIFF